MLQTRNFVALVVILGFAVSPARGGEDSVPDFGLMLNEDGNIVYAGADPDPEVCVRNLARALDALKGTPVRTLVYNIGAGSDILDYPTKAGSTWGWRVTADEQTEPWKTRMASLRPAAKAGLDSLRAAGQWAKSNGLLFVPSYRMNDAHYCHNPQDNALTGRFWVEHHERLTLKRSPVPGRDIFNDLLDFSHSEVREYRLSIIREASERYADVMDGFQLDFMRHPALFPTEATAEQAALVTEMIVHVRQHLDALGKKRERRYALMVRVPPTLKHSRRVGLDVETWLERRLVDVITPSPAHTLSHDMPIDKWVALAEAAGAKVYPVLHVRTQFAWPFTAAPTAASYTGIVSWDTSGPLARGAVINYRTMGAAGFELYNYNLPLNDRAKEAVAAAVDATPSRGDRVYAVTPQYHLDHTDTYEPPKQIPAALQPGKPVQLTLYVGEDVKDSAAANPIKCALRIGLSLDPQEASRLTTMTVKVNGQAIHSGPLVDRYLGVTGKKSRGSKLAPPVAQGYFQIPIEDLTILKRGRNEVLIEIAADAGEKQYMVCELALGVLPAGRT